MARLQPRSHPHSLAAARTSSDDSRKSPRRLPILRGTPPMVGGMDHTELTEKFLRDRVVTPVVLGIFADDEWESVALENDVDGRSDRHCQSRLVCGEAVEVVLDYPGKHGECLRDAAAARRRVQSLHRAVRIRCASHLGVGHVQHPTHPECGDPHSPPNFLGPSECTERRRRDPGRGHAHRSSPLRLRPPSQLRPDRTARTRSLRCLCPLDKEVDVDAVRQSTVFAAPLGTEAGGRKA